MSNERRRTGAHIFLHIGTMKTGTSYRAAGARPQRRARSFATARSSRTAPGSRNPRCDPGALAKESRTRSGRALGTHFAEMCRAHTGSRVIISSELISFVDAAQADAEIIESLRPNPVTVIITARDLARLLPSAWQNKVKHGRALAVRPLRRLGDRNDDGPKGAARSFWHHHDLRRDRRPVGRRGGVDNVVVIPVPGPEAGAGRTLAAVRRGDRVARPMATTSPRTARATCRSGTPRPSCFAR